MRTARAYFPNVEAPVLQRALSRLVRDRVFPQSVQISQASWDSAVRARQQIGDIRGPAPYERSVTAQFTHQALAR
jgi:hypothetical protein